MEGEKKTSNEEPKKTYYRLNLSSDRGKMFLKVLEEGKQHEAKADKLAKECGACSYVCNPLADMGGISIFIFPNKVHPDDEVFQRIGQKDQNCYVPNVTKEVEVKKWPYEVHCDTGTREHTDGVRRTGTELLHSYIPRKTIALALGIELEYIDPIEALRLLGVSEPFIRRYAKDELSMISALAPIAHLKKQASIKELYQLAIKADNENKAFCKEVKKHEYLIVQKTTGSEKALDLDKEIDALPVIPSGVLNEIVCVQSNKRIGFFVLNGFAWIQTESKSDLPLDKDFQKISGNEWEQARHEIETIIKQ